MKKHCILLVLLLTMVSCHQDPSIADLQAHFDKLYRDADLSEAKQVAGEKLSLTRENFATDAPEYIQALYDMALIYRRLNNDVLALHFYQRSLDEALRSRQLDPEMIKALFDEVSNYETPRIPEDQTLTTLQKMFRRELADFGYPSEKLNPLYQRLIPYLIKKKDGNALLYAAQNLILTGTEPEKTEGHFYLCLGHYFADDIDKFKKAADLSISLPNLDAAKKIRLNILLAQNARNEKGILRSRNHYNKALGLFSQTKPDDLTLLFDIYYGLGENYFLTRDLTLALEYETNAKELADHYFLGQERVEIAQNMIQTIQNFK